MNNVMKKLHLTAAAAIGVFCISMTSFAGQWRSDANGWWWQNDDGSYPTFCWQWIDGNDDGIAECYYFDPNGYCLLNTLTYDGSYVNETGAWTLNGIIQTQPVSKMKLPPLDVDEAICHEDGHAYYRIDQGMTWSEAKEFCESLGGHLVTITSAEEQAEVESLIKDAPQKQYWIGGYNDGGWKWVTGERWNYTHWASGEPNDYRNKESFAQIYRQKNPKTSSRFGQWNDISENNYIADETDFFSTEYVGVICEIEPQSRPTRLHFV